jgi:hypothetical protein
MANAKTDLKMKARNCALAGSCYPLMVDAVGDDEFLVLQVVGSNPAATTNNFNDLARRQQAEQINESPPSSHQASTSVR